MGNNPHIKHSASSGYAARGYTRIRADNMADMYDPDAGFFKINAPQPPSNGIPAGIIGRSPLMIGIFYQILQVIERDNLRLNNLQAPLGRIGESGSVGTGHEFPIVTIYGESGTGKELVAQAIHYNSNRSNHGRFEALDCGAVSSGLAESTLFGHERGAFTGAHRRVPGIFESAAGGTVFLDEIGNAPESLQDLLLRALAQNEYRPIGSLTTRPIEARIITATSHDLEDSVTAGEFATPLLSRVNEIPMYMPPLRERSEDVPSLVDHFCSTLLSGEAFTVEDGAIEWLQDHLDGNVRGLKNLLRRAIEFYAGNSNVLTIEGNLSLAACPRPSSEVPTGGYAVSLTLADVELAHARKVYERLDCNQSAAARQLGITRTKFRAMMKKWK